MQLRKELIFRNITREAKMLVYLFHGMQAADGVFRSRIEYTVSGFRRFLFFYIVQIGATSRYFNIR
jgi:hypothetical protein